MQDERPIMIADDDEDDIFFATRALKKGGVQAPIVTCANGREVIARLQDSLQAQPARLPRVIFLDIKMPELSGFDTLKWIRSQRLLADVAVVILSGSKESRDTELAASLGADDYLVKYPSQTAIVAAATKEWRPRNS